MTAGKNIGQSFTIRITTASGASATREIKFVEGDSLMLGSGATCGIQLDDPSVDTIHCLLRLMDGQIIVQDWCSRSGTAIDGIQVDDEANVPANATVTIGDFQLQFTPDHPAETAAEPESEADLTGRAELTANQHAPAPRDSAPRELAPRELAIEPGLSGPATPQLDVPQSPSEPGQRAPASNRAVSGTEKPQPPLIDPEAVELMRAEIECLQRELAERDRQLAELFSCDEPTFEEQLSVSDTEALVSRLEDLLEELDSGDQRVHALEELLLAEQELVENQEEEKRQIESWLGDIEERISAREGEWRAERTVLLARIDQLKSERDVADQRIQTAHVAGEDDNSVTNRVVLDMRAELDQLREQLSATELINKKLADELAEAAAGGCEAKRDAEVEDAIREERLALSQERAALSRERSELARMRSAVEDRVLPTAKCETEADERFYTLRETLKELHHEEQSEAAHAPKPGLGKRLAELWRRLDGPTDVE